MELIIGGCFQGKLDWAKQRLAGRQEKITEQEIWDGAELRLSEGGVLLPAGEDKNGAGTVRRETPRILNRLHLFIKYCVEEGRETEIIPALDGLLAEQPDVLIVCDEVGYGIVPTDKTERAYRETVGRTLCHLAKAAEHMVRITAGMPMEIS